jgi:hypothetical protein
LASGPTQTTLFIPDSTQWKTASVDLTSYSTSDHVDIKIVNVTDGGNALYIDSLKLGNFDFNTLPSSIDDLEGQKALLFPNPAQNQITLKLTDANNQNISEVDVTDLVGKKILELKNLNTTEMTINASQLSNGLYLLSVKSGNTYSQLKFIKQ